MGTSFARFSLEVEIAKAKIPPALSAGDAGARVDAKGKKSLHTEPCNIAVMYRPGENRAGQRCKTEFIRGRVLEYCALPQTEEIPSVGFCLRCLSRVPILRVVLEIEEIDMAWIRLNCSQNQMPDLALITILTNA